VRTAALRTRIALALAGFAAVGGLVVAALAWRLPNTPAVFTGAVVVVTIAAWFLGRWVARAFVSPIERLGMAAKAFASGNHTARATVEGPRETRIIGEAFNQMAAEVDSAIDELKREERRKTRFVSDVSHELRTPRRCSTATWSPRTSSASSRRSRSRPSVSAGSRTTS